jgi:tRNA threonylcarbamoyladenosine biosynthesis protein TsaE
LVEWGEGMVEQLADTHLTLRIDRRDDETRVVTLEPYGPDWIERIGALDLEPLAAATESGASTQRR